MRINSAPEAGDDAAAVGADLDVGHDLDAAGTDFAEGGDERRFSRSDCLALLDD